MVLHGFSTTEGHNWNMLWTNTAGKPYLYTGLNPYQKINHFPCSYEITRKNCLGPNVQKLQEKFSAKDFDFVPETYLLPTQFEEFKNYFGKTKKPDTPNLWIVKPNCLSRG